MGEPDPRAPSSRRAWFCAACASCLRRSKVHRLRCVFWHHGCHPGLLGWPESRKIGAGGKALKGLFAAVDRWAMAQRLWAMIGPYRPRLVSRHARLIHPTPSMRRGAWMELDESDVRALTQAVGGMARSSPKVAVPSPTGRPLRKAPSMPSPLHQFSGSQANPAGLDGSRDAKTRSAADAPLIGADSLRRLRKTKPGARKGPVGLARPSRGKDRAGR